MKVYIGLEILILILMVISKLFCSSTMVLKFFNLLPILVTVCYVTFFKKKIVSSKKPLYLVVLLAVIGDLFFVRTEEVYGIYFFFLIQLCLLYYLNRTKLKPWYLIILALLIFVLCYVLNSKYLIVQGVLYISIFLYNLWTCFRRKKYDKRIVLLFQGFSLLSICDINVFLIYFLKMNSFSVSLENICFIVEWICYICFQIFLTCYVLNWDSD